MKKTDDSSEEPCISKTYTVTAADEPGGILGTAMTEDTSEETAGETLDEHDEDEK